MKKNFKKLCALVLAFAMIATDALPVAAARRNENPFTNHFHHESYEGMTGMDLSILSERALEFLEKFDVKEFKSAFGKKVEGYNTEALKDAIWKAIFIRRDSNLIDVKSLGISQDVMDALVDEVLTEANAEEAVTYAVKKDKEGNATEIKVAIDPLYAEAYAEIEAGTLNAGSSNYTVNAASDEIVVAEGEEQQPAEPTMEEAIAYFNEYQKFIDDNPDLFGITVPYTSVKDDANEGGGPITSLVTIANQKVDYNGDGVVDANDNGITMLDLFKMGYVPAKDLIQIIQMFHLGNQLAAGMLGEELVATMQEALAAIPSDATDVQKLLILNDWLADKATFDMASIMELPAPQPTTPDIFYQVVGALQQQGLPEADAQMLAQNLMGLWGGNQFGVLTPSMGHKGVCMSYTYAYAYLVQWAFSDVYKNADGSWKTRLEVNYIVNPDAELSTGRTVLAAGDEGEEKEPCEEHGALVDEWTWAAYNNATLKLNCSVCGTTVKTVSGTDITYKEGTYIQPTCGTPGYDVYIATAVVDGVTYDNQKQYENIADGPSGNHVYNENPYVSEQTWEWISEKEAWVTVCCANCDHKESVKASSIELNEEKSTDSTCEVAGKAVYTMTAVVGGTTVTGEHTETLKLADHNYGTNGKCTVCGAEDPDYTHTCTYAEPTKADWSWKENATGGFDASYTVKCTVEGCTEEPKTVAATVESATTKSTCTVLGKVVYTATAGTYTDTKEVALKELAPHTYTADSEVVLGKTVKENDTVQVKCDVCQQATGEAKVIDVEAVAEETKAPTCTETGLNVNDVTVKIDDVTIVVKGHEEEVAKLGHDFGTNNSASKCQREGCTEVNAEHKHEFSNMSVAVFDIETVKEGDTVKVKCDLCGEEAEDGTVVFAKDNDASVAPTCTAAGKDVFNVNVEVGSGESKVTVNTGATKTTELAAAGHVYPGTLSWTWATDYTTATATLTCTVCSDVWVEEDIAATETVVTEPTCEEKGSKEYSATITKELPAGAEVDNATKVITAEVPATGHQYDETAAPDLWTWNTDHSQATAVYNCTVEGCTGKTEIKAEVTKTNDRTDATTCVDTVTETFTATITNSAGTKFTDVETNEIIGGKHKINAEGTCSVCGTKNIPQYVWDPSAPAMVDFVRITYDTEVTMYGESQGHFDSDHYWNAVKVDGQWYYVDPCYTDIYVECMIRDRVETDGNMSHLYFMFSDTNARELYAGNFAGIDTLYRGVATDTTYEKAWFAFARSPIYKSGDNYVYYYDSTDMISLTIDAENSYNTDVEYKIVAHDGTKADTDNSFATLIDFNNGQILAERNGQAVMQDNAMIKDLFEKHQAYQSNYPSIDISCDMEGSKVYFNIANCVLSYDVKTYEVVKVFEYNEVTAQRDLTQGLGGMAFSVIDPEDAAPAEEGAEATTLTVVNNPIASMTIKNGNMYVSIGTSIGFISGKKSMSEEDTSIGYQFEETNYNEDYTMYVMSEGQMGEEETNDNDEFMWSANFVDVIPMAHLKGSEHTFEEVYVEATCGINAYTENRCTECGLIEAGSRVEVEDTALDHHFIKFDEQYYTKEGEAWNTGTSYVCTICKEAKDPDELEAADHVGHDVYKAFATSWNEDYTEAIVDVACETCYGVNYDCVLADETVFLAEGVTTTDITKERSSAVVDVETGEKVYFWIYTATVEVDGKSYSASIKVEREEDEFDRNPFSDVPNDAWFTPAVLWAVEEGITTGYPDGTFGPDDFCTRAQAVTFLWRAAGEPIVEGVELTFPDVTEDDWFYNAVCWAVEEGITTGYPDGTFGANDYCSRSQIVTFIWRAVDEPKAAIAEEDFADVAEGDWYYDAVLWAVGEELTTGYPDGNFGPNDTCTRAQIVTFLYRQFGQE